MKLAASMLGIGLLLMPMGSRHSTPKGSSSLFDGTRQKARGSPICGTRAFGQTPSCQSTRSRWRSAPKLTNLIFRLIFV
jgi:hypothetical protein